jgi:K+-transporting ATPase ATPase C chain
MNSLVVSLKILALTLLVCCVAYPLAVLGFARAVRPDSAEGSLVRNAAGEVVGSRLIAQRFTSERYFWPRSSAVGYDGAGAGGSNLAPTNRALTERAREIIARLDSGAGGPAPADLVTASGSGLDPHISEAGARLQAARVAAARGLALEAVNAAIDARAFAPGGRLSPARIVNVLELNLAMDAAAAAVRP